tara:strand:- start:8126 stop:9469 length:1344 start_codon:yes stop_codon:yes gene_type:complete
MGLLDKISIFSSTTPKFDQGKTEWGTGFSAVQQEMLLEDTMTADNTIFSTTGVKFGEPKDLTIGLGTTSTLDLNTTMATNDDPGMGDATPFDLGFNSTLQQDSLFNLGVAYGDDNWEQGESWFQDLNGINPTELGIGFDLGPESTLHVDHLNEHYTHMHMWEPQSFYHVEKPILDLNGVDPGNGWFYGIDNPGKGQGKQVGGEDLHVHLLTGDYVYLQGNTEPWITIGSAGPSPGHTGYSEFQDLNATFTSTGDTPIFNFGKEPEQDPDNPLYDTLHEQSLLAPIKPGSKDWDLNGEKGFFHGNKDVRDQVNRMSLNSVPGGMTPSAYADLNNSNVNVQPPDGAPVPNNIYFHQQNGTGINRPASKQGLQIEDTDLHVHLLQGAYSYTHGLNTTTVPASISSPSNYSFQDLDIDIQNSTPTQYVTTMHDNINQYIEGGISGLGNTNY